MGIMTMENIIESIFDIDIIDEKDLEKIQKMANVRQMPSEVDISHDSYMNLSANNVSGFYNMADRSRFGKVRPDAANIFTLALGLGHRSSTMYGRMKTRKDSNQSDHFGDNQNNSRFAAVEEENEGGEFDTPAFRDDLKFNTETHKVA